MSVIVTLLMFIGWLIILVGGIMFLVVAFKQSLVWGLCCIFIPFVSLVFLIMHWSKAKNPFFIQLAGLAVLVVAAILAAATGGHSSLTGH